MKTVFCFLCIFLTWGGFAASADEVKGFVQERWSSVLRIEHIEAEYNDKEYKFRYYKYRHPLEVVTEEKEYSRENFEGTLLLYFNTMKTLEEYEDVHQMMRKSDGSEPDQPEDEEKFVQEAREGFSSPVFVLDEVHFGGFHIFICKHEGSIDRPFAVVFRAFEDKYYIIQGLVLENELVAQMSANRWDIEAIKSKYATSVLMVKGEF